MSYETLIGWRYLYRRGRHRRFLLIMLLTIIGVGVLATVLSLRAGHPPPLLVIAAAVAAVGAIACGVIIGFSIFTAVSIFGVVLGVSALTIVMSVTSGFQAAFQDKVLGVNAHVLVMRTSVGGFSMYRDVEEVARSIPGVIAVQPFVFND